MSFHGPICEGLHNRTADAPIPPLRGNRGGAKASPLLPFGTRERGLAASGFCIDACELPVLSYLQERGSSLQPFLFIAAISATRRILAIGAQVSEAGESLSPERFRGGHDRSGRQCRRHPRDRRRPVLARPQRLAE